MKKPEAKLLKNFVLKICSIYVLLTKYDCRTGRISSARGLDGTDRAQQGQYTEKRPRANQYISSGVTNKYG